MAVGTTAKVKALVGPRTQVVDLHGAMVMPGLNDVHAHPLDGGYEDLFMCNFPPSATFEEILQRVRESVAKAQPGDWIVGGSWGGQIMATLSTEAARQALDQASGGHPVLLRDISFHNRFANTAALQKAGIDRKSEGPAGTSIVKDAKTGEPTGLLIEFGAFAALEKAMPPHPRERQERAAAHAVARMNALGITGVQDAYSSEDYLRVWSGLDRRGGLSMWYIASMPAVPMAPGQKAGMALVKERGSFQGPHLEPRFVKFFLDGIPPARTAKMIDPYLPEPGQGEPGNGPSYFTTEELAKAIQPFDRMGLGVKIHAAGDGSVRMSLDAIAQVRRVNGVKGPTHHIAHTSLLHPSDYPRFRQLNVVADISPMLWFPTGLWMAMVPAIGPERAGRFFPNKDVLGAGALVAGGSDWPAGQATPDPWIGLEGLVTRRDPMGIFPGALGPEQALDLATAIRIYTLNSAKAMGLAQRTGSLKVGKSADFIILDRNLFKVPAEQIHQTQVQATYFQGHRVYAKP
ncbi:MAG: Amidohydrolase 3 [Holophagaceae bacterium]|nr:Amidohydrolase 3 [Holophagaceae bacterium]